MMDSTTMYFDVLHGLRAGYRLYVSNIGDWCSIIVACTPVEAASDIFGRRIDDEAKANRGRCLDDPSVNADGLLRLMRIVLP